MKLSVDDVTKLDVLVDSQVLTAIHALKRIPVESVSVIEIPVENFVRKHELVLSTAIGCGHSTELFFQFVKEIIDAQASALIISTGTYITQIPDCVLEYAEEHHFPLIEIPWEIRFSDITQAVMLELHQWQRSILIKSEEVQKQFLNLFMRGATLTTFAKFVQQELVHPIIIVDKLGVIYGKSPVADQFIQKWDDLLWAGRCPLSLSSFYKRLAHTVVRTFPLEEYRILQFSIGISSHLQGYLLLLLPTGEDIEAFLNPHHERIVEHAASIAALWFQQELAILETEACLRGDFVWSLAKGEIDSWDVAHNRAKSFGYNLNLPYVCILGYPQHRSKKMNHTERDSLLEHHSVNTVPYIREHIIHAAKKVQKNVLITCSQELFIIFLEVSPERIQEEVNQFIDQVELYLFKNIKDLIMSWGIGDKQAGIMAFQESYTEAKIAFDIGQRKSRPGHRSSYKNTGNYRLLLSFAQHPEIQSSLLSTIEPLIKYDQEKGMDLAGTLISYIRNKGNVSQTARQLNLHRQSLLYRLKKIETLIDLSLDDTENLFLLYLSLKLLGMEISQYDHSRTSL